MIRLFNVYYPVRTLVLLIGEALIVWASLLLGAVLVLGEDSYIALNYQNGYYKLFGVTALVLICSYCLDLYDTTRLNAKGELYFRLLMVPGLLAFILAGVAYVRPDFLMGKNSAEIGLLILTVALFGWRICFTWLVQLPILADRVYVLGTDESARRLVQSLRQNPELGVEISSWTGKMEGAVTRESVASHLMEAVHKYKVRHIILAMRDRRGIIPTKELLDLRMNGVKIEEGTTWLEKISSKIEVDNLNPSWLVLGGGFRRSLPFSVMRRALSVAISLVGLLLSMPLLLLIPIAIRLDSEGPIFYMQTRVGKGGRHFKVVKYRTMRQDAEAVSGPQWAVDNDPRVTRVGKFLRSLRLDDIPQLWCVLKGDMAMVGPRPERPKLVALLSEEIPYYGVRHVVRPGLTGWARVRYRHVSTIEDAREELQYDLFYIKSASIGLDLLIMFQTMKTVLVGRGGR